LQSKGDVKKEAVKLSSVISAFRASRENAVNIFVLDACRDNPFRNRSWASGDASATAGLALKNEEISTGCFAAFSASAGQTGGNGIYASALADEIQQPGDDIETVFAKVRDKVYRLSNGNNQPTADNKIAGHTFYFKQFENNGTVANASGGNADNTNVPAQQQNTVLQPPANTPPDDFKALLPRKYVGYIKNASSNKVAASVNTLSLNSDGSLRFKGNADE
jgi:hypothetical protein